MKLYFNIVKFLTNVVIDSSVSVFIMIIYLGNAVHLWRFDPTTRKLYISRSILFLKEQVCLSLYCQTDAL